MHEAPQGWTLAFRDGELEADYRQYVARRYWRIVFAMAIVAIAAWLLLAPFDDMVGGTAGNAEVITRLRLWFAVPCVVAVALVWLVRKPYPQVARQLWCALFLGCLLVVHLMVTRVPEPALNATGHLSAGFILIMLVSLLAAPVRYVHMAVPTAAVCGIHIWGLATYTDQAALFAPLTLVAYGVGTAGVVAMEQSRRRTFVLERLLDEERENSDRLLHNMVPTSIAAKLKAGAGRIAEQHDDATVLFADIVNFTPMCESLPPQEVVSLLDDVFSQFDAKVAELGLEKIKTIGDGYMAVGGVPDARDDHVEAVADLALALADIVAAVPPTNGVRLALRVGLDTGPLVAGVIGTSKLVYDLWGDTVNTANRMESHAEDGTIQVTAAVHARLRGKYALDERGEIDIKGKGRMTTFVLRGRVTL